MILAYGNNTFSISPGETYSCPKSFLIKLKQTSPLIKALLYVFEDFTSLIIKSI